MTSRASKALLILAWALAGLAGLAVLMLAMPLNTWRTGEAPGAAVNFALSPGRAPAAARIWIDTDAACGHSARTDPDDCIAILLLARQSRLEIAGISTVAGNADLDLVHRTATELIDRLERAGVFARMGATPPRVFRGAARGDTRSDTSAAQALRAGLDAGSLTIVALGPLTNVAAALEGRPDLLRRVQQIVAVMGRREGHWFHPAEGAAAPSFLGHGPVFRDFNFQQDVQAAEALLDMNLALTLVPYEAAREVSLTGDDLNRLRASGPGASWVALRSRAWLHYWQDEIGQPGFYPFDAVAASFVLEPRLLHCAQAVARIARAEPPLGWLGARALFVGNPPASDGRNGNATIAYCPEVDAGLQRWLRDALVVER